LDEIDDWFAGMAATGTAPFEFLYHPVSKKPWPGKYGAMDGAVSPAAASSRSTPQEEVHEAFLQGYSMVVNSLHRWSPVGKRLANALYNQTSLPVDVYLYLTPPHSFSYSLHYDVMDAFMIQLVGKKDWRICSPRTFAMEPEPKQLICTVVTMQNGDVMYVPFGVQHEPVTHDALSAHLTVNLERQFYVWASLIKTIADFLYSTQKPTPSQYIANGDFKLEGESPTEQVLLTAVLEVPGLGRMPKVVGDFRGVIQKSVSNQDVPVGFWSDLCKDMTEDVITPLQATWSKPVQLQVGPKKHKSNKVLERMLAVDCDGRDMLESEVGQALQFVVDTFRLHSFQHFAAADGGTNLQVTDSFTALAELRKADFVKHGTHAELPTVDQWVGPLLQSKRTLLQRAAGSRVLLTPRAKGKFLLQANNKALAIGKAWAAAVEHTCGMWGGDTVRGSAFSVDEIKLKDKDLEKFVLTFLRAGVFRIHTSDAALPKAEL